MRSGREVGRPQALWHRKKQKPEQLCCSGPVVQAYASGRQGFHEVLANRGFHVVVLECDGVGQIGLEDPFHLRIHFALIALCVPLLGPESDGDHLFGLGLREQGQELGKLRPQMTAEQENTVDALKKVCPGYAVMRSDKLSHHLTEQDQDDGRVDEEGRRFRHLQNAALRLHVEAGPEFSGGCPS